MSNLLKVLSELEFIPVDANLDDKGTTQIVAKAAATIQIDEPLIQLDPVSFEPHSLSGQVDVVFSLIRLWDKAPSPNAYRIAVTLPLPANL